MERIISVTETGVVNVRTMDEATNYNHRYCLVPNSDLTGQPEDVVAVAMQAWTPEVLAAWGLSHPPPTAEEMAQQAFMEAQYAAKQKALMDNLPSWSAVSTAVNNISNLAEAKVFLKKLSRVVYWLAKDTEK